jgi:GT2 family glycosyltransferase
MQPLLTIGIPAYDEWDKVERLLYSLAGQQTATAFEIVLIDDCHPDDLHTKVQRSFPHVRTRRNIVNQGPAYNRNRIIEMARGSYIAFFDADCIVPIDWVETVRPYLAPHRLISGRVIRTDGSLEWGPRHATWLGVSRPCPAPSANVASSNNMIVATAMARSIGGFNENLRIYFEDSLFSLRVRQAGGEIRYLQEGQVFHDHHSLRNPGRLRLQSRNTLWAMHHHYREDPLLQKACSAGLTLNYLSKAIRSVLRGEMDFARAYLGGIIDGYKQIHGGLWRDAWIAQGTADHCKGKP